MTHKPKGLTICLLASLPVIVAALGLATTSARPPANSSADPPVVPVHLSAPITQMPMPTLQPSFPFLRPEPLLAVNQVVARPCLTTAPAPAATLPPASSMTKIPFQEAHWQGIEVIPATARLKRALKIAADAPGVITDDITWPADMQGFRAGDLITSVGQVPTPNLEDFIQATARVRQRRRAEIQFIREGKENSLVLTGYQERLGIANGETAPMIKPGSRPPHGYMGACTNCHRIGSSGQLAVDQGDLLSKAAPAIRAGQAPPHRNRGTCTACHTIIP
jgi:hypothetical protein